jgi:hypothetical protein
MSIGKAQAELLATSFLDDIGESKDGLQPRETFSEIILLAGELIESAQENLNQSTNNASGNLSESLQASEPEVNGTVFKIDVYMNFYGRFQNKGVKGTHSGNSTAGYFFKNEYPSKNMVKAIAEWIRRAQVSTQTVKQYQGYGKHEIKNRTISEYSSAYAKAKSIKMYGIKPTSFLDKAVQTTQAKVKDRLGLALKVDVIDAIKA